VSLVRVMTQAHFYPPAGRRCGLDDAGLRRIVVIFAHVPNLEHRRAIRRDLRAKGGRLVFQEKLNPVASRALPLRHAPRLQSDAALLGSASVRQEANRSGHGKEGRQGRGYGSYPFGKAGRLEVHGVGSCRARRAESIPSLAIAPIRKQGLGLKAVAVRRPEHAAADRFVLRAPDSALSGRRAQHDRALDSLGAHPRHHLKPVVPLLVHDGVMPHGGGRVTLRQKASVQA
jgi:hypothetical protein